MSSAGSIVYIRIGLENLQYCNYYRIKFLNSVLVVFKTGKSIISKYLPVLVSGYQIYKYYIPGQ